MQFADNAGPDQPVHKGLRCPLTDSIDTVVYIDGHRMFRLGCTVAHADLELH